MHTCIHAYMHTCIHAYMHTCIHAYMHTCIHAYMHTCIHAYMHTCIHAYMHTCIHAYMHTCIHAYMHTCIHAYMHTCIHYRLVLKGLFSHVMTEVSPLICTFPAHQGSVLKRFLGILTRKLVQAMYVKLNYFFSLSLAIPGSATDNEFYIF